ncbi:MAG: diadenylate cyclase CdaA [Bacteroidales bacterium]|nr:diadenylate cyclase CdaA [Candidatus Liminaster caballi]
MWDFGIKDAIDILVVAWALYYLYRGAQRNGTLVIFQGIMAIIVVWLVVSQMLQMRLLGAIMDSAVGVGLIAVVIIFQNDIRQVLVRVGSRRRWSSLLRVFGRRNLDSEEKSWVDPVVLACRNMSQQKVGALICIEGTDSLQQYADTGDLIDARLSTRLIEQIFYKNTPLHDGAMIIRDGRIVSAACILPVSHSARIPKEFGLRHRSGIGLSEVSDAKVIIVSEETGGITLASHGRLHRDLNINTLQKLLLK